MYDLQNTALVEEDKIYFQYTCTNGVHTIVYLMILVNCQDKYFGMAVIGRTLLFTLRPRVNYNTDNICIFILLCAPQSAGFVMVMSANSFTGCLPWLHNEALVWTLFFASRFLLDVLIR